MIVQNPMALGSDWPINSPLSQSHTNTFEAGPSFNTKAVPDSVAIYQASNMMSSPHGVSFGQQPLSLCQSQYCWYRSSGSHCAIQAVTLSKPWPSNLLARLGFRSTANIWNGGNWIILAQSILLDSGVSTIGLGAIPSTPATCVGGFVAFVMPHSCALRIKL